MNKRRNSPSLIYVFLATLVAVGAGVGIVRLINGLGSTTSLSDAYPWGLWIVYDVFFVPFSAGAFMILAITHIYGRKEYHSIARPVVLAGFLGEVMVIAVLVMDLGRWHQFYNILFPWYWNIHSFMFQVSICLTIYMGVMVLEIAPVALERLGWQKPLRWISVATVLIAGAGIVLSSLHQSSLGSLFLLMPYKLNALWWTPLLPLLFFASAAFAGLSMVIFVVTISFKAFHRPLDLHLLINLARVVAVLLGIYLLLKIVELAVAGEMGILFSKGWPSILFLTELVIGVLVPMVLFSIRRMRESQAGLICGSSCVLAGVALNRTNVALLAYQAPAGTTYFPNWMEILISVAAVAAGVLLFALAVRFLPILPKEVEDASGPLRPAWSRRTVVFGLGVLSLLTITVVLLLQPATQVQASRLQATPVPAAMSPREGYCQECHGNADALADAGADGDALAALVVEPLPLKVPHSRIGCVTCHFGDETTENVKIAHTGTITDPTRGDASLCIACHQDLPQDFPEDCLRTLHDQVTHGQVIDVSCSDCHGAVGHGFDPVSGEIICTMGVCLDCHISRQLDSDLTDCDACHIAPHALAAATKCDDCHQSTQTWQVVKIASHSLELAGAHAQARCLDCHPDANFEQKVEPTCSGCHQPPGEDHYGLACEDCHTPTSFQDVRLPDHPVALVGAHEHTACAKCHTGGQQTIEYVCSGCHERPKDHLPGRCDICHTPQGWADSISFVVNLSSPIPHGLDGQSDCLICHDPAGQIRPAPSNHGDYGNEQCALCHKVGQ